MVFSLVWYLGHLKTAKWTLQMEMRPCVNLVSEVTPLESTEKLFLDLLSQVSRVKLTQGVSSEPTAPPAPRGRCCGGGLWVVGTHLSPFAGVPSLDAAPLPGQRPTFLVQPLQKNRVPINATNFLKSTLKKITIRKSKSRNWMNGVKNRISFSQKFCWWKKVLLL